MLLSPGPWALAFRADEALRLLSDDLTRHATSEMHGAALELATGVHQEIGSAARELSELRARLGTEIAQLDLRAASAGTHPFATWQDTVLSSGERYEMLYGSIRELARREPTFGLHVHIGIPDPEDALRFTSRVRAHLPLFLALSGNSPFWQGRDTGLASARTPLFMAFPRVGIPRAFSSYHAWVEAVDVMIRCEAIPEPTVLWWDVRPQPRFGTVEIRIMDAQSSVAATGALAALVQSVARLELEEGYVGAEILEMPEVLDENRFMAARDGLDARLIDPVLERRVPVVEQLRGLLQRAMPHAQDLGCAAELAHMAVLAHESGAKRQLTLARRQQGLPGVIAALSAEF